jgi:predicted ATP-grasp superfamily ATP-dependent carboligase
MDLKIYKHITVERPTMLAAWPGMGSVAYLAIDFLCKEMKAELFGEIDISQVVVPDGIVVEDGVSKMPRPPRHSIYYRRSPDVIILQGETQLHGKEGVALMERVVELVERFHVSRIFTGAAFPLPISYDESPAVYGCATTRHLREFLFNRFQVKPMDRGEIQGLNGLLLGYAQEMKVPAACLLATMPFYALDLPNPKASRAITKTLARILGMKIDTTDLDIEIEQMEKEMLQLEERIGGELTVPSGDETSDEISSAIRQRIERLFREAGRNRDRAYVLKEELDKWDLFESYEDRFLDLFKQHL